MTHQKLSIDFYILYSYTNHFRFITHCVKSPQIRIFFWSVSSPNAGKYGPENTPYLDTFHAVTVGYVKYTYLICLNLLTFFKQARINVGKYTNKIFLFVNKIGVARLSLVSFSDRFQILWNRFDDNRKEARVAGLTST